MSDFCTYTEKNQRCVLGANHTQWEIPHELQPMRSASVLAIERSEKIDSRMGFDQ